MLDFSLMAYKNEIIDDLCNLIRIDSVKSDAQSHMPYGKKVFEALMYMLNLAESLDLDNVNLFSRCGYVEYGEGDDLFVILTHLDVVPACAPVPIGVGVVSSHGVAVDDDFIEHVAMEQ